VHEQVLVQGRVGKLKSWFLHFPFDDLEALVAKINRYSSDAAQMMALKGRRVGVFGLLKHSVWTFIRIYVLRRGFLDGRHGLVLAVTAASGSFLRYSKLMFLNEANQQTQPKPSIQANQPTQSPQPAMVSQASPPPQADFLNQTHGPAEPK
jgi:hypothetical protein